MRVPWTARRSNQSILKEISSEYSLEVLMLKLKLQYFGYLMRSTDSLEKTPMVGKIEKRLREGMTVGEMAERHHQLDYMSLSQLQEMVKDREASMLQSMGEQKSDTTEYLN